MERDWSGTFLSCTNYITGTSKPEFAQVHKNIRRALLGKTSAHLTQYHVSRVGHQMPLGRCKQETKADSPLITVFLQLGFGGILYIVWILVQHCSKPTVFCGGLIFQFGADRLNHHRSKTDFQNTKKKTIIYLLYISCFLVPFAYDKQFQTCNQTSSFHYLCNAQSILLLFDSWAWFWTTTWAECRLGPVSWNHMDGYQQYYIL